MVACPQNGTSHRGEKYRTRHAPPSGAAKAVSENPTSAAIACIFAAGANSAPVRITARVGRICLHTLISKRSLNGVGSWKRFQEHTSDVQSYTKVSWPPRLPT